MHVLTEAEIPEFIAAKPAAAIHVDAEWNTKYRDMMRTKMLEAESALSNQVNFGEIDCDTNAAFARSIRLANVPLVAYYRNGRLVATLVGATQDVRARLQRVLLGEKIGHRDGLGKSSRT